MSKYDNPRFDDCRKWIQKKRERGASWQELRLACKHSEEDLCAFLSSRVVEDDWPVLSEREWVELVSELEEYEDKQKNLIFRGNDGALFDINQDNGLRVPENERSCWQLYKKSLGWNPDSVQDLEDATIGILRRLSSDTREIGPIKGLVIGHVQSGKTANMEALMAMAADHGWNMFIVLSGTIESLRLQTLKRMQKDLNHEGNLIWRGIEHPSKKSQYGERAQDFHFEPNAQSRYFTVCLKNASRLKKLIDWIHADKASHDLMKILIIDDEADQASISTLSRGLTIEGLVSTFFLRASCQADTLMQMGRWFGYRKNYELMPRIWMTSDTCDKFRFLSELEVDLRSDLKKYMISDVTPLEYGPRILSSPKVSWLRLTSKNHMRNAKAAEMDFSGAKPQTSIFDNDVSIQQKNIEL